MARSDIQTSDIWLFESAPCETCPSAALCKQHLMACQQGESFVRYGGRRWSKEERLPSRRLFDQIFGGRRGRGRALGVERIAA